MRIVAVIAALLVLEMPLAALAKPHTAPAAKSAKTAAVAAAAKSAEARHISLFTSATQGNVEAQYQLAQAFRDGRGAKRDSRAALTWFSLAGTNGMADAAVEAAKAYENGQGTARDLVEAGRWYYRAGTLGHAAARQKFVDLFIGGKIPSVGGIAGAEWIGAQVEHSDLKAMIALGEAWEKGEGVAPNSARAEHWYRLAADLYADAEARFRLGRLLAYKPAAWRVLDDEQWNEKDLKRDQQFGAVWLAAKPEENADKAVQFLPGIVEGERWLVLAANQGHAGAQALLGQLYLGGVDLPFDAVSGTSWLEAAAAQNQPEALMALAESAASGLGFFTKDPVRAYVLFDLAAAVGRSDADGAREHVAKALSPKQLARARQLAEDSREMRGL
jgi:TPR repeat protein